MRQDESAQSWANFLQGLDIAYAQRLRLFASQLRQTEAAVASAAGLASVYTSDRHAAEPSYRQFLERLAEHAAGGALGGGGVSGPGGGPVAGGRYRRVPLMVKVRGDCCCYCYCYYCCYNAAA